MTSETRTPSWVNYESFRSLTTSEREVARLSISVDELKLQVPKGWKEREQELTSRFTSILESII